MKRTKRVADVFIGTWISECERVAQYLYGTTYIGKSQVLENEKPPVGTGSFRTKRLKSSRESQSW